MQVVGMKSGNMGYKYNGALEALQVIVRTEGIRGLYRGLWPNLRTSIFLAAVLLLTRSRYAVKVSPSIATSFFTYELVKDFLVPHA
jgi:solute carrier family 25 phosphate transporter 23/24/25/41